MKRWIPSITERARDAFSSSAIYEHVLDQEIIGATESRQRGSLGDVDGNDDDNRQSLDNLSLVSQEIQPTEEELRLLRRVADDLPWSAWLVNPSVSLKEPIFTARNEGL
jgi:hypothetical protein